MSSMKYSAPPVWIDDRSCDEHDALAARLRLAGSSRRSRDTLTSTRRSDDTSFDMNAKSPRSRSRNSGVDANAVQAADDAVAGPNFAQLAAHGRAVGADDDDGVHALARDRQPSAVDAHVGPHVRRRVEVVWDRAVPIGDAQRARRAPRRRGSRAESAPRPGAAARPRSSAETFSFSCEKSSLVRPISKC